MFVKGVRTRTAVVAAHVASVALCLTLSGCHDVLHQPTAVLTDSVTPAESDINLDDAAAENRNRMVKEEFKGHFHVFEDPYGLETLRYFFPESPTLVISDQRDSSKLRAASIAVSQRAPMLVYDESIRNDIYTEMARLGVDRALMVGQVPMTASAGSVRLIQDPGTTWALGQITAFQFESKVVANRENMARAVAHLDGRTRTELKAAWEPLERLEDEEAVPLPAQSRRDADMAPIVVATEAASVASVANARSYGAGVRMMPTADPRESKVSQAMVEGMEDGPLVALGPEFGDEKLLADRIREGWSEPRPASGVPAA
ncbi:hypothetical protein ACEE23_06500 [Corynebacterium sp. 32222D000AT]|uniref:hypothetical protein n=1 Tax=unclassified Corynebacterium TaxID=2624378 RepID=UPI002AA0383E|nr:hypothetical protein [Mycobacteriaceae bacterium]MDY5830134.1 hypothetical protein [Corynebacterium sp.]